MNYVIDRGFYRKGRGGLRKERKGLNSALCGFFAPVAVNCLNCDSCDYNDFYDSIGDINNALKGQNQQHRATPCVPYGVGTKALKGRDQNVGNGLRPFRAWASVDGHIHRALPCAVDAGALPLCDAAIYRNPACRASTSTITRKQSCHSPKSYENHSSDKWLRTSTVETQNFASLHR